MYPRQVHEVPRRILREIRFGGAVNCGMILHRLEQKKCETSETALHSNDTRPSAIAQAKCLIFLLDTPQSLQGNSVWFRYEELRAFIPTVLVQYNGSN